jgi:predicted Zn-dependent protease
MDVPQGPAHPPQVHPPHARPPRPDRRILSHADCRVITDHLGRAVTGGGVVSAKLWSDWTAGVRWGRNEILDTSATTDHRVNVTCMVEGAESGWVMTNEVTEAALVAVAQRAERLALLKQQSITRDLWLHRRLDTPLTPPLFDETTYQQEGGKRVALAAQLIQQAEAAGMVSSGYIEVSAHSLALMDTLGRDLYFRYTWAQCSVTVRDPQGTGSGWAGVDWPAWNKINPTELGKIALDKCLHSRNPARIEPGRYTTILEPQAVFDLVNTVFGDTIFGAMNRDANESPGSPFSKSQGQSMLGDRVMDPRLTIRTDPMDPDLGFPPFWNNERPRSDYDVYQPITYVKDGVLMELAYNQRYGVTQLGRLPARPAPGTFRMSGGTTSVAEMIASTKRGILVTRFSNVGSLDLRSGLVRGYTRDGTWFIENGQITKPIVNLAATESVLFMLNNVEQLGVPQRIFNPPYEWVTQLCAPIPRPAIVPPLKIRDFSFTALIDAV